jgi:predicted Holliday junction resolvase-like endonuclease
LRGQLTSSQDVATGGLFTLNHHDIQHLHRAAAAKKEAAAQLKEAKKLEAAAKKQKQQENKLEREIQKKQRDVDRAEKSDWTLIGRRLPVMDGKISFKML